MQRCGRCTNTYFESQFNKQQNMKVYFLISWVGELVDTPFYLSMLRSHEFRGQTKPFWRPCLEGPKVGEFWPENGRPPRNTINSTVTPASAVRSIWWSRSTVWKSCKVRTRCSQKFPKFLCRSFTIYRNFYSPHTLRSSPIRHCISMIGITVRSNFASASSSRPAIRSGSLQCCEYVAPWA